jgi:hypothetical protein
LTVDGKNMDGEVEQEETDGAEKARKINHGWTQSTEVATDEELNHG